MRERKESNRANDFEILTTPHTANDRGNFVVIVRSHFYSQVDGADLTGVNHYSAVKAKLKTKTRPLQLAFKVRVPVSA
jgi:hypothetical protein